MTDELYHTYDEIIGFCLVEANINWRDRPSLVFSGIDFNKVTDIMMLKIAMMYGSTHNKYTYYKGNYFDYLKIRKKLNFNLSYWWPWKKQPNLQIITFDYSESFFKRPCQATNQPITIISDIYNEYYKVKKG